MPWTVFSIGGANVDKKMRAHSTIKHADSNPVTSSTTFGGVARNMAENLHYLGLTSYLISLIGRDAEGRLIKDACDAIDLPTIYLNETEDFSTGTYTALLSPDGSMHIAMAEMAIFDEITETYIEPFLTDIKQSDAIALDTNIDQSALDLIIREARLAHIPLYVDPVSMSKAEKLPYNLKGVTALFPNVEEAESLTATRIMTIDDMKKSANTLHERGVKEVIMTLGERGVFYSDGLSQGLIHAEKTTVNDVTGAGDALIAMYLYQRLSNQTITDSLTYAVKAASLTIQSNQAVTSHIQSLIKK